MTNRLPFQEIQQQITAYIRDPKHASPPKNVDIDRLNVYKEILFNNLAEIIENAFPVCFKILTKKQFRTLIRGFFKNYRINSPFFHDIPKAFVDYLWQLEQVENYPIFLSELAHYEWVELALDIYDHQLTDEKINKDGDLLDEHPVISPYAWLLQYQFPVHKIGKSFQPTEVPEQETFLIISRDKNHHIEFTQINILTAHLLNLLLQNPSISGKTALQQLGEMIKTSDIEAFIQEGLTDLKKLQKQSIIIGTKGDL